MRIKIFGERNTGTNLLRQLIGRNSASEVLPGTHDEIDQAAAAELRALKAAGADNAARQAWLDAYLGPQPIERQWKHAATRFDDPGALPADILVVLTTRHPLSWLLSLHRHAQDRLGEPPDDFLDFLAFDWPLLARDRLGPGSLTPPALWQAKLAASRSFAAELRARGRPVAVLPFELLATDQRAAFESLRPHLDRPADRPAPIEASTKRTPKDAAFYRDRYGEERWRDELPSGARAALRLDPGLLAWAGYAL
jgi:hypothetical protein